MPARYARKFPPDAVLVPGLRDGDEAMFAVVVDSWSGSMLRVARSFVNSTASAEDVVQETWISVMRGIGAFAGRSSLRTWVYRILVNTAKRRGVRDRRTVPIGSISGGDDDMSPTVDPARFNPASGPLAGHWASAPSPWPAIEDAPLLHEVRAVIGEALERVPPRQRVVLTLRDIEGRGSDEVSEILGITLGNQRVLLHRARAVVRTHLDAYAPTPTGGKGHRS